MELWFKKQKQNENKQTSWTLFANEINKIPITKKVKMQKKCDLIGWNGMPISDTLNCHKANIHGMWNPKKLGRK